MAVAGASRPCPARTAIAAKTAHFHPGWVVDPETQITVTCGATEGMIEDLKKNVSAKLAEAQVRWESAHGRKLTT